MAEAHNPTLLAAEENLRAVRAQELQAAVRANPYLTLYGTDVTLPADGCFESVLLLSAGVAAV